MNRRLCYYLRDPGNTFCYTISWTHIETVNTYLLKIRECNVPVSYMKFGKSSLFKKNYLLGNVNDGNWSNNGGDFSDNINQFKKVVPVRKSHHCAMFLLFVDQACCCLSRQIRRDLVFILALILAICRTIYMKMWYRINYTLNLIRH